jgi:hypothetical protein
MVLVMHRNWEQWLATAAGPASATEEQERDRTEQTIRDAIRAAPDIPHSVSVYAKGSYANGTNVRRDADVDVAVEWTNVGYVDRASQAIGRSPAELGYTPMDFDITPPEFRQRVERAVSNAFLGVDTTPDKHIGVPAGSGHLEADVVPCFTLYRYDEPGTPHQGHRIFSESGGYVDNFPAQHNSNGNWKNEQTRRRYKELVRCAKRLIGELFDDRLIPRDYPGYLIESLVYNVLPNTQLGNWTRYQDLQNILNFLWYGLRDPNVYNSWTEPSELIYLFQGHSNRSPSNALNVIHEAWNRIGVPA